MGIQESEHPYRKIPEACIYEGCAERGTRREKDAGYKRIHQNVNI